jgi:3-isopropylmalate/(R)-2-methylmalate dehydratase small subunit
MDSRFVDKVSGRAIPLRGHDIDTDRIIPARFLKSVSFEGLETHAFEDDRKQLAERGQVHAFWNPRYAGAKILIVNGNFGCGSSREHAPQAIQRWGIRAIIGESFSEIFFGNSAVLGIPCFTADKKSIDALQALIERAPSTMMTADVATGVITAGDLQIKAELPAAVRDAFVSGQWNPTAMLLDNFDKVRAVAAKLPYVSGF